MLTKEIKFQIQKVYGGAIQYPRDCEALAACITEKTGNSISSSTLKRFFGFVKSDSNPSRYTLDTIAIYLGFESYGDLQKMLVRAEFEQKKSLVKETLPEKEPENSTVFLAQPKKSYLKYAFATMILLSLSYFGYHWVNEKETLQLKRLSNLPEPRSGGRAITQDDFIYYIGGSNVSLVQNNCWRYNIKSDKWKKMTPMHTSRAEQATALVNGKIYVFGGWLGNSFGMTNSAEVYDIEADKWDSLPPLPVKITSANAVSHGNDIYILGGTIGETTVYFLKFNTINQSYESLPTFGTQMMYCSITLVNNKIYAIGGNSYVGFKYRWHDNLFEYDIDKKYWIEKTPIPIPITASSLVVDNNKIHLFGGKDTYGDDNKGIKESHFIYNITTNSWELGLNLPYPICTSQSVLIDGKTFLIGGMINFPNPTSKVVWF